MKVLLTESPKGIGYKIAKDLIKEGHQLALHYNSNKSLLEALLNDHPSNSFKVKADLSVENEIKNLVDSTIENLSFREEKVNSLLSKFELDIVRDIKTKFLSGGQKKKLVIALALISDPKILLLDEPFAALDVMTIKTLQEIIINLQTNNNISVILCDHQARDLLACVDTAAIIHNGKVVAQGTPRNLIQNIDAKNVYFGDSFKIS